jgi:hypothetical protein
MPIGHRILAEEAVVEQIVVNVIRVSNHRVHHVDDVEWDVDLVAARRKVGVTFAK